MRYKEVYDRVLSIISEVPFLDIFRNQTTVAQKIQMARAKFKHFYKPSEKIDALIKELEYTKDFKVFDQKSSGAAGDVDDFANQISVHSLNKVI